MHDYEKDRQQAIDERASLLERLEIVCQRIDALETLIRTNDRHKGKLVLDQMTTPAEADVNVAQPQVTESVRGLLTAANGPLTGSELLAQLKQLGWDLGPGSQALSFMYGIGRRLVQQGFATRVEKNGRMAWVRKKPG